jgi:4-amino-4-deoxy-L-arabinose transferase-like glycosyltransferase
MTRLKNQYKKIIQRPLPWRAVLKGFVNTKFSFYLLLGISILILSAHLGLPPFWGSEGRWAVIARSMLRSGDFFSPTLAMNDYWDKPLLSYWQILPFSYIHGSVSEFTARFPSVVWAVVMLLLTYHLAKRWFEEQTALLSIGTLATTYTFVFWGRNAQVEMTNAAMILLCLWYFIKHKSDHRHTWVYILSILMALGANMKGLLLYAVPIFCILILSIIKKDWSWIPPLKVLAIAGLLSLVVFLAVPAVACIHGATWSPLHMIWKENVLRFFGLLDHKDPFYTYFIKIFYLAAPWSLILPFAIIRCVQLARRRISQTPEALILFGTIFIFFTLSGSRRPYYLLPILPFVAILAASILSEYATELPGRGIQAALRAAGILLGLTMIALLGVFILLPQILPTSTNTYWFASVLIALVGVILIISTMKKYIWGMVGSVFAAWLICVLGIIPLIAEGPNIRTQVAKISALGRPCGFLNFDDAKVIFYLDKPYQVFYDKDRAIDWAIQTDGVLLTSIDFSDPSWECIVKGHHWQAVIHRRMSESAPSQGGAKFA